MKIRMNVFEIEKEAMISTSFKRFCRSLYRKVWDFPRNWKPWRWEKYDMSERYWLGFDYDREKETKL